MVKVKICGITRPEDAIRAAEYGADQLGFIFVKGTPRYVCPDDVSGMIGEIDPGNRRSVGITGLFKDEDGDEVLSIVSGCGLDNVQLQGAETPGYCDLLKKKTGVRIIKAFKAHDRVMPNGEYLPADYVSVDLFVFDTFHPTVPGGTGMKFEWEALVKARPGILKPFFIAGGLTPSNVAEAVNLIMPYGVDVSSGVESSPGRKDAKLLKEFIENAKKQRIPR